MAETFLMTLRLINRRIALLIGMGLLAVAGIVLVDIVLRQMGSSFGGTDEISGYAMAIAAAWGMGYALLELAHVRIDLLRSKLNNLPRTLLDLFSLAVLAASTTAIAIFCWPVLRKSFLNGANANTPLETTLWYVQLPWFLGWAWFALMAWLTFAAAAVLALQGHYAAVERSIGAFAEKETLQ